MKHYGDITKLNGSVLPEVDCIIGGSPCQDLSVAGYRKGLEGERSSLFLDQIRIVKEMRENGKRKPRFMVWENVRGAITSNKGEDFRRVLEETVRIKDPQAVIPKPCGSWTPSGIIMGNGFSVCWRIHDAQFWGVPQRRTRIALVADFDGVSAPEILFERKSVSGDSAKSREKEKASSGCAKRSFDQTIGILNNGVSGTLDASYYKGVGSRNGEERTVVLDARGNGNGCVCPTLTGDHESRITDYTAITYHLDKAAYNQGINARYEPKIDIDVSAPLVTDRPGAVYSYQDVTGSLMATGYSHLGTQEAQNDMFIADKFVRRLTPLECERLQGFPDNWTDIGPWKDSKGKLHKESSDAQRYKAIGNSIAIPFWLWMVRRMSSFFDSANPLMGSLFDGIAGFPLCWESVYGPGTAVWASEIDDFAIAVSSYHFPERKE